MFANFFGASAPPAAEADEAEAVTEQPADKPQTSEGSQSDNRFSDFLGVLLPAGGAVASLPEEAEAEAAESAAREARGGCDDEATRGDEGFAENFDPNDRYLGTVQFFSKLKRYGFVIVSKKSIVPNDVVFVHWQSIKTTDRYAFLSKGMEVEFSIQHYSDKAETITRGKPIVSRTTQYRAAEVTLPGGEPVQHQDQVDAELKTFVGGIDVRYLGTLKFYDPKLGYGYITVDKGYNVGLDETELRVERSEVNTGGSKHIWLSNVGVEFGIWETTKGSLKAYNMTLAGGIPLTQAAMENRVVQDKDMYRGEVKVWNWKQGWGFIKVDADCTLPALVQAKLQEQVLQAQRKAASKGKTDTAEELLYFRKQDVVRSSRVDRYSKVVFQVYTDDKGAGAQEIQAILAEPG